MMYRISIPNSNTQVLNILDSLVTTRSVEIPNVYVSRSVGCYLKPWRKKKFVSLYIEPVQKRTVLVSNVDISKKTGRGKKIEFCIDDSVLKSLNVRIPYL